MESYPASRPYPVVNRWAKCGTRGVGSSGTMPPGSGAIGRTGPPPEINGLSQRSETFTPNWEALERGTAAHQTVVRTLHRLIEANGGEPLYPDGGLNFDISWMTSACTYVAEVKSLTADNEADQIRLGLGQVLDYHWSYCAARPNMTVKAVLVTERAPRDPRWVHVCAAAGVLLTWPGRMGQDLGL